MRLLQRSALLTLAVLLVATGCTTETQVTKTVDATNPPGTSGTDNTGTTDNTGSTNSTGSTDNTGSTGTDSTGSTDTTGTGGTEATENTNPPDTAKKCGVEDIPDGKGIGEPCAEHTECETGYCYTEYLWNEDGSQTHRFCTVGCTGCTVKGNCDEWKHGPGIKENKCFPFTSSFINHYGLKWDSVCLATCQNDGDCAAMGGFSSCAKMTFGKDYDYGVHKVCQPPDFPKLDPDEF